MSSAPFQVTCIFCRKPQTVSGIREALLPLSLSSLYHPLFFLSHNPSSIVIIIGIRYLSGMSIGVIKYLSGTGQRGMEHLATHTAQKVLHILCASHQAARRLLTDEGRREGWKGLSKAWPAGSTSCCDSDLHGRKGEALAGAD